MAVEMRLAIPMARPRAVAFRARRDRLLRWFSLTVTVIMASGDHREFLPLVALRSRAWKS